MIKQCDDDEQQLVLSLRRLEDGSKQNILEEQNVLLVEEKEESLQQTLMPSDQIVWLLSILNKIRAKLRTIMIGNMSAMERSDAIEYWADTITGLEEGTQCSLPVACITNLFN